MTLRTDAGQLAGHADIQSITVTAPGFTSLAQQSSPGMVATMATGYRVLGAPGAQFFSGSFAKTMYWSAGIAIFRPTS